MVFVSVTRPNAHVAHARRHDLQLLGGGGAERERDNRRGYRDAVDQMLVPYFTRYIHTTHMTNTFRWYFTILKSNLYLYGLSYVRPISLDNPFWGYTILY